MLALSAALASLLATSFAAPQGVQPAAPATYTIVVGGPNGELTFKPEAIFANVGDKVIFEFHQKNHTATQSSFADPCGHKPGGFNSGYEPVADGLTSGFPTYEVTVNDTQPIWVYCAQGMGAHCHAGMVFAVNCPSTGSNTFDNFKASAMAQGNATASSPYGSAPTSAATGGTNDGVVTFPGDADVTIPPAPSGTVLSTTIELEGSTWSTTYTSYAGASPNPTPNSLAGNVITVMVGNNGEIAFDPPHVAAQPRDIINFQFMTKNHSVTQSSFADPCRALSLSSPGTPGVDSGFMPVPAGGPSPSFNVTVNSTDPLWFYCRQTGHCGKGMVFAVNSIETSARNFAAFQTLATEINGTSANSTTPAATPGTGAASARYTASVGLAVISVALGALLL